MAVQRAGTAGGWLTPKPAPPNAAPAAPPTPGATPATPTLTAQGVKWVEGVAQVQANQQQEQESLNANTGPGSVAADMADLQQFGISVADAQNLSNWYLQEQQKLKSPGQILIDFYQTPIFAKYFPGIVAQMKAGNPAPMSPQDYVQFKQDVYDFTASMGLPKGFVNDETIGKMVASNMTLSDIGQRISAAQSAAQSANPETLQLMRQWYGVAPTNGGLAAYYLDPTHSLFSANGVENTFAAANIGAEAEQGGFKNLDRSQLLSVAQYGGTAASEKGNVAQASEELQLAGPGGARLSGTQLSEEQLLGANLGGPNAGAAARALTAAQKGAAGRFESGGNYGTGGQSNAGAATE